MLKIRHEILNGRSLPMPSFGTKHQLISLKIAAPLLLYVESGKLGQVIQAPCDVMLSRAFIVHPDIVFLEKGRCGLIEEKCVRGSPDIIVEILCKDAPETLDRKRKIYSLFEVKEYWVVDLCLERIEVLLWSELGYASAGLYAKSDRLSSPSLPGFKLPLGRVFRNGI